MNAVGISFLKEAYTSNKDFLTILFRIISKFCFRFVHTIFQ